MCQVRAALCVHGLQARYSADISVLRDECLVLFSQAHDAINMQQQPGFHTSQSQLCCDRRELYEKQVSSYATCCDVEAPAQQAAELATADTESLSGRAEHEPSLSSQPALEILEGAALQATPHLPQAIPISPQATPDSPQATPDSLQAIPDFSQATPHSPQATPHSPQVIPKSSHDQQQQKTATSPTQQPQECANPVHTAACAAAEVHCRRCPCACVGTTSHAVHCQGQKDNMPEIQMDTACIWCSPASGKEL